MVEAPRSEIGEPLRLQLESAGRRLGARESSHRDAVAEARRRAEALHAAVAFALEGFHAAASEAGAPHLEVALSPLRVDDKHLRSIEFELRRGRHRAIVTVKSRGEVTLVGPFRAGKTEGPCSTFPFDAEAELSAALGNFLEAFVEEAATP
ncbi:MAG: hypothetical protein JSU66_12405 [Deltaproteobacteria bacterium]|nr:MAG: hypothetical protein JSU66_12405 [Deltaproteobacteria bacterium]